MELQLLHMIQGLHNGVLDAVMILLSTLGNAGIIWIAVCLILLIPKRTRKCGLTGLVAMLFSFCLGNLVIKNLVARERPCGVDPSVTLLIPYPSEYSFPSGHTLNGFTAATVFFLYYKKAGIIAYIFAGLIAFSRMYLFVHYPTDILGGIVLGVFDGVFIYALMSKIYIKYHKNNTI